MAREAIATENAVQRSVDTHKTSAFGVSERQWLVAEVKPTQERSVRDLLLKLGYEAYVPSQERVAVYKNYTRHKSEHPIIPGVVFVRLHEDDVRRAAASSQHIYRFMPNRARQRDEHGGLHYAVVTSTEMQQLDYICRKAENPVVFADEPLKVGQKVRIMRGPLAGVEGFFLEQGNSTFVVVKVSIGRNSHVKTEVQKDDVQPISK